jgi:hypothetical protein
MHWKEPLTLLVLGLAGTGVMFGIAFAIGQAGIEWPLLVRLPFLAIVAIPLALACMGLLGLLLAASPKLRRHVDKLESQPKQKRRLRREIEAHDRELRARRRRGQ